MKFLKPLLGVTAAMLCAATFAAVDVNKATQDELQTIKGIGPSMSSKMIEARKAGAFKDWDDLQSRVKGVGPGNATKLSAEGLTVGGAAFGEPPVAEPTKPAKPKATSAAKK